MTLFWDWNGTLPDDLEVANYLRIKHIFVADGYQSAARLIAKTNHVTGHISGLCKIL